MAKNQSTWHSIAIGIICVFVGLVALAFTQSIFNLFFVAIVVGVLWNDSNKLQNLSARLNAIEERLSKTQTASAPSSS